jgi:nitrate/nitrite-specific signal transduction histidine kinase
MSDDRKALFGRADEFMSLFKRGAEFSKELIAENERLRRKVLELEQHQNFAARDDGEWDKLRAELLMRIENLEEERSNALERLRQLEEENHQFARRYVEVEEENNNLANLYVASFQLHSTLDLSEVVKIVIEIVINLIGAEMFAVYMLDEKTNRLEAVASEGEAAEAFPKVPLGSGIIGGAVESGETFCGDPTGSDDYLKPIVCIPLRVQDRPIGALAVYRLLQQKDGFSPLDHELFTLLAGHAATSIFSARLYSQSERKRNTIQGFIDLLTK